MRLALGHWQTMSATLVSGVITFMGVPLTAITVLAEEGGYDDLCHDTTDTCVTKNHSPL
jgi:hypothetical protein